MTEHHDQGAPTDPLVGQLQRYADAAELVCAAATSGRARRSHRSSRPLFAVASVLVLLVGALGAFALARDDGRVAAVRAPDPSGRDDERCPRTEGQPDFEQLRVALPFVAASSTPEVVTTGEGAHVLTQRFGDTTTGRDVSIAVTALADRVSAAPDIRAAHLSDPAPVTVRMCDPSGRAAELIEVDGLLSHTDDTTRLTFLAAWRWGVVITTDARTSTDVLRIAQGITWGRAAEPATTTMPDPVLLPADPPCGDDTLAEINLMRVTYLPEGFAAAGPAALSEAGPLDTETSGVWAQDFVDLSGRSIRVMNFWSNDPPTSVIALHDGAPTQQFTLDRCGEATDMGASISETAGRTVVSGQDWGHGGLAVRGGTGVTRDEVLAVASGLR